MPIPKTPSEDIKRVILATFVFLLLFPLLRYVIPPLHDWLSNHFITAYSFIVSSYNPYSPYNDYTSIRELEEVIYHQRSNLFLYIEIFRTLIGSRPVGIGSGAQHAVWLYFQIYGVKSALFGSLFYYCIKKTPFSNKAKWLVIFPMFFHGWGVVYSAILLIVFYKKQAKE